MEFAALAAVLTALGGVVKIVLGHADRQERRFITFLGNHMSKNTAALEHVARSVELLKDELEEERKTRIRRK